MNSISSVRVRGVFFYRKKGPQDKPTLKVRDKNYDVETPRQEARRVVCVTDVLRLEARGENGRDPLDLRTFSFRRVEGFT